MTMEEGHRTEEEPGVIQIPTEGAVTQDHHDHLSDHQDRRDRHTDLTLIRQ